MSAVDPIKIFADHPDLLDKLIDAYNLRHAGKISADQRQMLQKDPPLAESIFNGGLRNLIADGHISIGELKEKPQVRDILRNPLIIKAVKNGVLSIGELEKIDPENLKMAGDLVAKGGKDDFVKAGGLLGLNEERTQTLVDFFSKANDGVIIIIPAPREPLPQKPVETPQMLRA